MIQAERQPNRDRALGSSKELAASVVSWFRSNGREFPWRDTRNPFHILIAEILLRQTQAARVVSPYTHLVTTYPDPASLAATDVEALRRWFRPLGLVLRADRLVECARRLLRDYGGQVPEDLGELQSLPGIGRYSARATLCMAFNHPLPMIDEGSGRVLDEEAPERVEMHFAREVCEPCSLRSRCPVRWRRRPELGGEWSPRGAYVLSADLARVNIGLRRRAESDGQWRKRYGLRAGIEGTNSELKRRHGLGRLRVRGGERVRLAVYLKALACNVKRMVRARLDEMLAPPAALATAPPTA